MQYYYEPNIKGFLVESVNEIPSTAIPLTEEQYHQLLTGVNLGYTIDIVEGVPQLNDKPLATTKAEKTAELLAFLDTVVQTSVTHSGLEFAPNTTNVVYLLLTAKQSGSDFTVIDDTDTLHENVSQATVSNICTMLLDMIHSIRVYRANKLQEIANAETNEQVEAIVIGDDF